jgi:putative transposase
VTWVAHDIRDSVVDFIAHWSALTELSAQRLVIWSGLSPRKFSRWRQRYGKANEHNALVPRDHWLEEWEKEAIIEFFSQYPLEGHRRLAFMMLDRDLIAVSPFERLSCPQRSRPALRPPLPAALPQRQGLPPAPGAT